MTIRNYALCKNGTYPHEWQSTEDIDKPRYGRLLFVKKEKVLLMQIPGKPWKLPGCLLGHLVDQEQELSIWTQEFLGIQIDQFEAPLGLFTVGIRREYQTQYEHRETLVHVPMMWRESEPSRSRLFDTLWQPIDTLMRYTSFPTKDFIREYQEQSLKRVISYDFAEAS